MHINLIAAVGDDGQIGLEGEMPWRVSEDLKWFKHLAMDHIVVVGHNTHQTLPELNGRYIYVQHREHTPEMVIDGYGHMGMDIFVAGGAATYKLWMPYIQRFYISHIRYDGPADTFFPGPLPWS